MHTSFAFFLCVYARVCVFKLFAWFPFSTQYICRIFHKFFTKDLDAIFKFVPLRIIALDWISLRNNVTCYYAVTSFSRKICVVLRKCLAFTDHSFKIILCLYVWILLNMIMCKTWKLNLYLWLIKNNAMKTHERLEIWFHYIETGGNFEAPAATSKEMNQRCASYGRK
jgi:hypothetical protein